MKHKIEEKTQRKKILYCEGNKDGTLGGSYFSLFFLIEALDKNKYEPIVIFYDYNELIPKFRTAGAAVHVFKKKSGIRLRKGYKIQVAVNFFLLYILQGLKYACFLKKKKISLVHLNNSITRNHAWIIASIFTGIKCITHQRGIENISFFSIYLSKKLDGIICISKAVRDYLINLGINQEKLSLIYNGVDPDKLIVKLSSIDIKALHQIEKENIVIGIVGNIKALKGQLTVIKALALIRKKNYNISCLVVGDTAIRHRAYKEELLKVSKSLNVQNEVIYTGFRHNVSDYINAMDIVILASIIPEGFGRVTVEAMSLNKPVVGSKLGGVTEIITDGLTGYLFEPGNEEELANCVIELIKDPKRQKKMGREGFKRVNEVFHIKRNIEQTQNFYEALLKD